MNGLEEILKTEPIAQNKNSKIYTDGYWIVKYTDDISEYEIAKVFQGKKFSFIAEYIGAYPHDDLIGYFIIKEKININKNFENSIEKIFDLWDNEICTGAFTLDYYIRQYLNTDESLGIRGQYSIQSFSKQLPKDLKEVFNEFLDIIEELKSNKIFFVDFNPDNFGEKNDHLALFELGKGKIKK